MLIRNPSLKAVLLALLFALPMGACDCGSTDSPDAGPDLACGEGTFLKDGECVARQPSSDAGPGLECGPGTVPSADGSQCVPDLECAPGTAPNDEGTGCIPACQGPFVLEGDSCVCPAGLVPIPGGGDCQPDPELCAEGTVFDAATGQCRPMEAPPPADDDTNPDGAPVIFELPGIGEEPVELGGIIGPVDATHGADLDVFEFEANAGDRIRVQLVSVGAQAASFLLVGADDVVDNYFRIGFPGTNRRAVREIVFPATGRYTLIVSDRANVLDILGAPAAPVGGSDHTYALVIDTLPDVAPTVLAADSTHHGVHDDVDAFRIDPSATPAGGMLHAHLAEAAIDPDYDTVQILWYIDGSGRYVEVTPGGTPAVDAFLPQLEGGTVFHVDFLYRLGAKPRWGYQLSLTAPTVHEGPAANQGVIDGNTGGEELSFFAVELEPEHVYRARLRLPTSTTISSAWLGLLDENLNMVAMSTWELVGGVDYQELHHYVRSVQTGVHYLVVFVDDEQNPLAPSNFNVRLSLEQAPVIAGPTLAFDGVTEDSRDLADPVSSDSDAWGGPWVLTTIADFADVTISTTDGVEYEAYDASTFEFLPPSAFVPEPGSFLAKRYRVQGGTEMLVHARLGDEDGTFTLGTRIDEAPLRWESEPNDSRDEATELSGVQPQNLLVAAGPCDLNAPPIESSGIHAFTLPDPVSDDFASGWDGAARDGPDAHWKIPPQPEGTEMVIEVLPLGPNGGADTYLALLDSEDCTSSNAVRLASDDDGASGGLSRLTYTWGADDGELLLLLDSWQTYGPLVPGDVVLRVEFSNAPLPSPVSYGRIEQGDSDWWRIDVARDGLLTLEIKGGPLAPSGDVAVTLYESTSTHVVAREEVLMGTYPGIVGLLTAYVEIGTYYALVELVPELTFFFGGEGGVEGGYSLSWELDPYTDRPSSCAHPFAITGAGSYMGDTRNGLANWQPADATCFGYGAASYAGPDDVYAFTVPAQSTVRAAVTTGNFDAAVAIVSGCSGACLAGGDEPPVAIYRNDTSEPEDVLIIVDGWGGGAGPYVLDIDVYGTVCVPGEQRCTGDRVEICNADGTGFDATDCPAGCTYDPFEQVASCTLHCGEGTANPNLVQCDGNTLQTCSADRMRYDEHECAVACSEETDEDSGEVTDAFCTFGLCEGELGGTVCVVENIDGVDVGVERTCSGDASESARFSCQVGCNDEGTACAEYVYEAPPVAVVTEPAPAEGACDLDTAPVIDASGIYTVEVTTVSNNFDRQQWNGCSRDGPDVYWLIAAQPAGTVITAEVLAQGENADSDTYLGLLSTSDCNQATATCLRSDDSNGSAEHARISYTVGPADTGDLLLLIDSWQDYGPLELGELAVRVELTPPPPPLPVICAAGELTCDDTTNVFTACATDGTAEGTHYCEFGCTDALDGCKDRLGENCSNPEPIDVSAGDIDVVLDLSDFVHDMNGNCSGSAGRDRVFSFTAPVDGTYVVTTSGQDTTLYFYEGVCGQTIVQCSGDVTGIPPSGWGSRVTINATAGTEYFFVVDLYSSNTAATGVRLEIETP